jgi:hypothetical protein
MASTAATASLGAITQPPQIQLVDKHVDRPHRIVFTYAIVKELGQQNASPAVLALDKALHQEPRLNPSGF